MQAGALPDRPTVMQPEGRLKWLADGSIAFVLLISGFVVFEPAPYELSLVALLAIWVVCGLRIPSGILLLLLLLTLFNVGGVLASFQMADYKLGFHYIAVSYFLALTSIFFAAVVAADGRRLALIFKYYVIAAVLSTLLGLCGYFGVPGFGVFTLYGRSAGGFADPNVYGPFMMVPILYLIYLILNRGLILASLLTVFLLAMLIGLFLAFSRAAWGLAVFSIGLFYVILIINERDTLRRFKYIILAVLGFLLVALALVAILQVDTVATLFSERGKIVQEYDGGRLGRFARHLLGFQMAVEKPFGIGPLQFETYYIEATHNNYLKALLDYGWLGFACWISILVLTLAGSFKLLFRPRPWQVFLQIAWVVFLGHQFVGIVIDTDHWRHYYLLIGLIWGCMVLEQRWQRRNRADQTAVRLPKGLPPARPALRPAA